MKRVVIFLEDKQENVGKEKESFGGWYGNMRPKRVLLANEGKFSRKGEGFQHSDGKIDVDASGGVCGCGIDFAKGGGFVASGSGGGGGEGGGNGGGDDGCGDGCGSGGSGGGGSDGRSSKSTNGIDRKNISKQHKQSINHSFIDEIRGDLNVCWRGLLQIVGLRECSGGCEKDGSRKKSRKANKKNNGWGGNETKLQTFVSNFLNVFFVLTGVCLLMAVLLVISCTSS